MAKPPPMPPPDETQDDGSTASSEELMGEIARPVIGKMLVISVGIHLVVLLLTSIHFISQCFEHHTFHPRAMIKAIEQKKREEADEAKRKAAREKSQADRAKKKGAAQPGTATEPTEGEAGKQPKVIEDLKAKSGERPTTPDVKLDELE